MALVPSSSAEITGRAIYRTNPHLKHIAHFMEHPESRAIYDQYFGQYEDLVCFTMFLKIYEEVEKHSPEPLTPYQKIYAVKQLIDDGNHRQMSVAAIQKWFQDNRNKIH